MAFVGGYVPRPQPYAFDPEICSDFRSLYPGDELLWFIQNEPATRHLYPNITQAKAIWDKATLERKEELIDLAFNPIEGRLSLRLSQLLKNEPTEVCLRLLDRIESHNANYLEGIYATNDLTPEVKEVMTYRYGLKGLSVVYWMVNDLNRLRKRYVKEAIRLLQQYYNYIPPTLHYYVDRILELKDTPDAHIQAYNKIESLFLLTSAEKVYRVPASDDGKTAERYVVRSKLLREIREVLLIHTNLLPDIITLVMPLL